MNSTNSIDINSVLNNVSAQKFAKKSAQAGQQFQAHLNAETGVMPKLSESEMKKIDETAQEFEAMFLSNMLEQMYSDVKLEKPFGGGNSEGIYRSMLIGKYAENMAASGGIGIASQLKDSMYKMQLGI
ncbi:MAG: rod-binding protein [Hyphomicrobiales bacterium]